jgi:hypothetical protein
LCDQLDAFLELSELSPNIAPVVNVEAILLELRNAWWLDNYLSVEGRDRVFLGFDECDELVGLLDTVLSNVDDLDNDAYSEALEELCFDPSQDDLKQFFDDAAAIKNVVSAMRDRFADVSSNWYFFYEAM